ncbi:lipoprotein insertase outer membrane protein LolB [Lysobacter sp. A289]
MSLRHGIAALLVLLLAACVAAPVRPDLGPAQLAAAEAAQQAREQTVRAQQNWSLIGRIGVSNDGKGGSGRIDWTQTGPRYHIALSAPVTRQSWHLSGGAGAARLEGLEGGPRTGPDARMLLLSITGWDIPVVALAEWARGARAQALGPARIQYGSNGLPWRIEQDGWAIEYEWPQAAASTGTGALPSRVDAVRGNARVKLIIDQWRRDQGGTDGVGGELPPAT